MRICYCTRGLYRHVVMEFDLPMRDYVTHHEVYSTHTTGRLYHHITSMRVGGVG